MHLPGQNPITLRRYLFQSLVFLAATIFATTTQAQTGNPSTWQAAGVADWDSGANWSTGNLPDGQFSQYALIDNGSTAFVDSLLFTLPGAIEIPAGTLEIRSGALFGMTGTILVDRRLVVSGTSTLDVRSGGTMANIAAASIGVGSSFKVLGPSAGFSAESLTLAGSLAPEITSPSFTPLNISGAATLGGSLDVTFGGLTPPIGSTWDLISAGSIAGSFTTVTANGLGAGHSLQLNQVAGGNGTLLKIEVVAATPPEIVVEQPLGAGLSNGDVQLFPNTALGASSPKTFTIRNTGSGDLLGLAITKDGADASAYTVGALGSTSLTPGASTTFDVTFSPSTTGLKEAAIHIESNDADENPFEIQLRGTHLLNPLPVAEIKDGVGGFNELMGARSVHVSGTTAYVASYWDDSLTIIDVSNLASPVLLAEIKDGVGGFNELEGASSVHVTGNTAYVTSLVDDSLTIIDVSNPASPVLLAAIKDGVGVGLDGAVSVHVSGTTAYVTSVGDDSLTIIDVSTPASPVPLAVLRDGAGGFNALNGANSVHVSGNTAYVASFNDDSLTIIDVSNPASPVLLAEIKDGVGGFNALNGANSVYVSGNTAYVASSYFAFNSLTIIDVSNPASPVLLAELKDGDGGFNALNGARSVHVSGNTAYVASEDDDSLTIIDVSNPASPVLLAEIKNEVNGFNALNGAGSVYVSGNTAYVASDINDSLTIIDVRHVSLLPEIVVEQPPTTALSGGGSTTTTFPAMLVGGSTPLTFTIRNAGSADSLSGLVITKDGVDAADFTVGALGATTLAPGASTTFVVTFSPSSLGAKSAAIHIASNDPDENPFDLILSGTGVSSLAEIVVEQPPGTEVSDGDVQLFPNTALGASSPKTFTIHNTGTEDLQGLAITKDGADASAYTVGALGSTSLAPGASTTFDVTFSPSTPHLKEAAIHIESNDADENPFKIQLRGTHLLYPLPAAELRDGVGGFNALNGARSVHVSGNTAYVASYTGSLTVIDVSNPASPILLAEIKNGVGGFNALNGASSVHVSGNTAYVASEVDDSLTIIDVSNPASPVILAELKDGVGGFNELNGAYSVHISGTTAYVASWLDDSLTIIDVNNPASPVLLAEIKDGVGGFNALNGARSVHVSGNTAYVASENDDSLTIIDVSNPASPVLLAEIKDRVNGFNALNGARSVHVSGNTAYVASRNDGSLTIIDVSNLSSPVLLSELRSGFGGFNALNGATSVHVSGNTAYVASYDGDSLTIIDVNNPASPVLLAELKDGVALDGATSVHVSGNTAYVASEVDDSLTIIDLTPVGLGPEIAIDDSLGVPVVNGATRWIPPQSNPGETIQQTFTIRNIGSANLEGLSFSVTGVNASEFTVTPPPGTILVPGDSATFIMTFTPSVLGLRQATIQIASTDADENPFEIRLNGFAAVPTSLQAEIVDGVGGFNELNGVSSVHVSGTTAYVASFWDDSLTIIDASNPASPVLLAELKDGFGGFNALDGARSVHVTGNTAYVASYWDDSLTIIDVSDPTAPALLAELKDGVGGFNELSGARSVHISGTTAYVASFNDDSLTIIDVSNPFSPVLLAEIKDGVGGFNALNGARSVHVSGNTAYVASDWDGSLTIIDVSNLASPVLLAEIKDGVGGFNALDGARSVHVSGNTAYVASFHDGSLTIIDVSNPASPVLLAEIKDGVGGFNALNGVSSVHVSGTTAYVTSYWDDSLTIIDVSNPASPVLLAEIKDGVGGFNALNGANSVYVSGNTAYVTSSDSTFNSLTIIDVSQASLLPEIVIEQPLGVELANGVGRSLGAVSVGEDATLTFTIRNDGDASLTGLAVTKDGTDAALYTVGALGATTLAPGETTTFTVTFAPTSLGAKSAAIHIASSDPDENPFDLILSGTGIASLAEIVVEQPLGTELSDGGVQLFPNTALGASSPLTFTIRNTGTNDLLGLAIAKDGPDASAYTVGALGSTSLAPGDSTTFDVTFSPSTTGLKEAAIHIESNDADESPFDIQLRGTHLIYPLPVAELRDEVSGFNALNGASSVHVSGNTAYVASEVDDSLTIIDVSNPAYPVILAELKDGVGGFNELEGAYSVHISGTTAYVASWLDDSLTIIDVNNPASPVLLAELKDGVGGFNALNGARSVHVSGNTAYVASLYDDALTIIDVTNPASPSLLAELKDGIGGFNALNGARSVHISGNTAYVASFYDDSLTIIDVSNPAAPALLATLKDGAGGFNELNGANSVHVSGTTAYVASFDDDSLTIIDVSNPVAPVLLAELKDGVGGFNALNGARSVHVSGTTAYVASFDDDSLTIIDVSNPVAPVLLAELKDGVGGFNELNGASSVHVSGTTAYVTSSGDDSLTIIDVSQVSPLPEIVVEQPSSTALFDGGTTTFPASLVGGSVPLTFTIRNVGSADITGLAVTKDGSDEADFTVGALGATTLTPGASTTFAVTFSPSSEGAKSATLHIASNDADENPFDIDLTGAGIAAEIAVEQPAGVGISDESLQDFGSTVVGGSAPLTFTIRNLGSADLTGLAVTKDGTDAALYTVGALGATVLAPGETTTFTVIFAPTSLGAKAAAIHIASNDADENPFDIDLTGTGIAPEIAVEQPAGVGISDGSLQDFGSTVVGGSAPLTFTIRNLGSADLTGLAVTKDGTDAALYTVGALGATVLAPGETTTFTVIFAPTSLGAKAAAIHIASNDADENPFDIDLTGTGIAPEIAVEQPAGAGISDGSLQDFGSTVVGGSAPLTFTIRNLGSADLTGLAVTKDGTDAALYTVGALGATVLAPGETTTFTVIFAPTSVGAKAAAIHIASNDADEDPFDIALTGTGVVPDIVVERPVFNQLVDGATVDIGSANVGGSANGISFTIRNTGSGTLSGLVITSDGPHADDFTVDDPVSTTVAPGSTTTFTLNFSPSAPGVRTFNLYIASNDPDENPFDLTVTGTGLAPEIVVEEPVGTDLSDGGSLAFGDVETGSSLMKTVTVRNDGTSNLSIYSVSVTGTHASEFVAGSPGSSVLAPGQATTFALTFMPGDLGPRTAALRINSNDGDEALFDLALSGTGVITGLVVESPPGTPLTSGSTAPLGNVLVGQSETLTLILRNPGSSPLTGITASKSGFFFTGFTLGTPGTTSLASGESTTLNLTFAPTGTGGKSTTLTIDTAQTDPFTLVVTATGLADTDGDQASNAWENANGFDPNVAGDIDTLDTDGDGDLDIMEIYQGTSRTDPTQHHGLLNPSYSGPGILTVRYRRDLTQSAVVGTPRWSPDLLAWHGSGESVEGVTVDLSSAPVETVPGPPSAEISEMTATVSSGTSDKLFLTIELKPNE